MPNQTNQTFLDRLVAVETAAGVTVAPGSTEIDRLAAIEKALDINYADTAPPFVSSSGVVYDAPIGAPDRLAACEAKAGVFVWQSRQGSGGQYFGGY
jgi:hypothetical protein